MHRGPAVRRILLGLGVGCLVAACASGTKDDGEPKLTTSSSPNAALDDAGAPPDTTTEPNTVVADPPATKSDGGGPLHADASDGSTSDGSTGTPPVDAAPPPPPPPSFTVTNEAIAIAGETRTYVQVVPSTYSAAKTYPLVVLMHGDSGDGPSLHGALPMENTSGQDAILLYPSGKNRTWDLYTRVDQDKDVMFLEQLVGAARGKFHIGDAFAYGMSSGAFMANQMACRRPTLFKGIISNSGGTPDEPNDTHGSWGSDYVRCNGQNSGVAAMIIHGENDTTVPFPSGLHDANYWATVNGCGAGWADAAPSPCQTRNGCPADKAVYYCAIPGMGHEIWSNAAVASWTFISAL